MTKSIQKQQHPSPLITFDMLGHRGGGRRKHHPVNLTNASKPYENSLNAFKNAMRSSRGLEVDLIRTRDGHVALIHDELFTSHLAHGQESLLQGRTGVREFTLDELQALCLQDGTAIPSLRELLDLAGKFKDRKPILNLELKGPDVAEEALEQVEIAVENGHIARDQIIFSSFYHQQLADLRFMIDNDYKIGVLFEPAFESRTKMYDAWTDEYSDAEYIPFSEECLDAEILHEIKPDFINLEQSCLDDTTGIAAIRKFYENAKIMLWTSGEPMPCTPQTEIGKAVDPEQKKFHAMADRIIRGARRYPGLIHSVISDFPVALAMAINTLQSSDDTDYKDPTLRYPRPVQARLS